MSGAVEVSNGEEESEPSSSCERECGMSTSAMVWEAERQYEIVAVHTATEQRGA